MYYIGFRMEIASRIIPDDLEAVIDKYNASGTSQILNLQQNGKITVDKSKGMIIARGGADKRNPGRNGAMINFAIVVPIKSEEELTRIVQIINVLGNGRLIRERTKTFMEDASTLNQIPELQALYTAIKDADALMPGLINGGWYYAPEAYFDE